jgi:lysyl-tRNA synthetase class 2
MPRRAARRALLAADNVFQLERLHSFSRKFHPVWRPRYVCVEKLTDLPLVGLAYLHLEQLLVPPGPWSRRERVSHS